MSNKNTNRKLWDQVEKTDPLFTKQFSRTGGFKGTATNATYLAMRATEVFGPAGIGWGMEILNEEIMQGAPIIIDGQPVAHELIHKIRAKLWYILDGQRGEVVHFGQTQFVGRNKNGLFSDEEAPKKSLTDAMTKCLSLLGFAADIHSGRYDDNKYVNDIRAEFDKIRQQEAEAKELSELEANLKTAETDLAAQSDMDVLKSEFARWFRWAKPLGEGPANRVHQAYEKRKRELTDSNKAELV